MKNARVRPGADSAEAIALIVHAEAVPEQERSPSGRTGCAQWL
jgi:hypothetical protein